MARKSKRADTHNVALESGGTVQLSITGSVFDLTKDDREFVNFLVDTIKDYERSRPETKRSAKADTTSAE